MSKTITTSLAAAVLLLAASQASAYTGFVIGRDDPARTFGRCEVAGLEFTGPDRGASLFVLREYSSANDILYSIEGNSVTLGCTYGNDGVYDCPGANFQTPPTSNDETVWVIATFYPNGEPGTDHHGWLMYDNTPGLQEDMAPGLVANVVQRLRWPETVAAVREGGTPGVDPPSGVHFSFEYLTEFDTRIGDLPCDIGGLQSPVEFDNRLFIGFNVYRLNETQTGLGPDDTTPMHYLCGPDLDCNTTADNGFVTFIPLGDCITEICIEDPAVDPHPDDAYGVEYRGHTNPDLIFSDHPDLSPRPPVVLETDTFWYVYQPVARGAPTGDWNGIPSHDLDGDTIPEFLDPSGNGLGLTANGVNPTQPWILVSPEVEFVGPGPTPVGSITLEAWLDRKAGGVYVTFLTTLETDLVGFHVYRSADGEAYTRVTGEMIPAAGDPAGQYEFFDPLDPRRVRGTGLWYLVEAWNADGTVDEHGPFLTRSADLKSQGRGRRR